MDTKGLLNKLIEEKNQMYRKGVYGYTQRVLAYNSNKIEGSTLTEEQTASLFDEGIITPSDDYYRAKDVEEMNGHFLMFNYMLSTIDEPLNQDIIKQFHYELKSGVFEDRANGYAIGDYKKRANMVGTYKTCLPSDVPSEMDKLIQWYHDRETTLNTIAEFHMKYEIIHPFQDGNGRTGRIIIYRECLKNNIFPAIVQDKNRRKYIEALNSYRISNDVNEMVDFLKEEQNEYFHECEYFFNNNID